MMIPENENTNLICRQKLEMRLCGEGGNDLEPYEIIELLLRYVDNQRDKIDVSRSLVKKFGSLYNIFEAEMSDLLAVGGICEQSIALLMLQSTLARRYSIDKFKIGKNKRLMPQNAGRYVSGFFYGYPYEMLKLFLLNSDYNVIKDVTIAKGSTDSVTPHIQKIVSMSLNTNAAYAIIAHNHPRGTLIPSAEDIDYTKTIENALSFVNKTYY